jgi:hypothetical protein
MHTSGKNYDPSKSSEKIQNDTLTQTFFVEYDKVLTAAE